jgi:hypothetical protein
MGYTKLFNEIVLSTIWRENDTTRLVWITMLALRNKHHVVEASVPGLADCARVSVEACREALKVLSDPDPDSRSQEAEGRRIEACEGGWFIINGEKFRRKMSEEERREKNAIYQARWRKKQVSIDLTSDENKHSKSKRKSKEREEHPLTPSRGKPELKDVIEFFGIQQSAMEFFDYYESNGWRVGRNPMKDWKAAARRWKRNQNNGQKPKGTDRMQKYGIPI